MCKYAGTCNDDNNLYFEQKMDAVVEWHVLGISPDVNFSQATSLKPYNGMHFSLKRSI